MRSCTERWVPTGRVNPHSSGTGEQSIDFPDAWANLRLKQFLQSPWENLLSARLLPRLHVPGDFYSYLETNETGSPKQKQAESLTFCVRLKYLSELGVFSVFIFHLRPEHLLKSIELDQPYHRFKFKSFRDLNFQINKIKCLMKHDYLFQRTTPISGQSFSLATFAGFLV